MLQRRKILFGYKFIFLFCSILFFKRHHCEAQSIFINNNPKNLFTLSDFPKNTSDSTLNAIENEIGNYTLSFENIKIPFHRNSFILDPVKDIEFVSLAQVVEMFYKPFTCYHNQLPVYNAFLKIQIYQQNQSKIELQRFYPIYKQPLTIELNGSRSLPQFVADTILKRIDSLTIIQFSLQPAKDYYRTYVNIYFWPLGMDTVIDSLYFPSRIRFEENQFFTDNVPVWFSKSITDISNSSTQQIFKFKLIENLPGTLLKLDTTIAENKNLYSYYKNKSNCKIEIIKNYQTNSRYIDAKNYFSKAILTATAFNEKIAMTPLSFYSLSELPYKVDSNLQLVIGELRTNDVTPIVSRKYFSKLIGRPWTTISNFESFSLEYGECLIKTENESYLYYFDTDSLPDMIKFVKSLNTHFTMTISRLVLISKSGRKYSSQKTYNFRVF